MNRRGMLKGLGAAAAASLWPGWLSEAFAGAPCGVLRGAATLGAAIQRAHQAVQPLLVLVIPRDDGQKWDRGRHFGEWLNFGSDRDLAALACAEVVCSEMAVVRQLFPSAPSAPADLEPAALIAQVERTPAQIALALELFAEHQELGPVREPVDREALNAMTDDQREDWYRARRLDLASREDAAIQPCIDRTGSAIRQAVLGDLATLKRRADARWDRLTAADRDLARRILGGGEGAPREVMAVAPLLASAAEERGGAEAERLTRVLAEAARVQYCTRRIPGSKWARASGCGETIEGDEQDWGTACGMGHVPRRSQRFLYFFTRSPFASPTDDP